MLSGLGQADLDRQAEPRGLGQASHESREPRDLDWRTWTVKPCSQAYRRTRRRERSPPNPPSLRRDRDLRERIAVIGDRVTSHRRFAPWHSDEATSSTPETPASITASRDACAGNRSLTTPHAERGYSIASSSLRTGWRSMSFRSRSCATTSISCSRFGRKSSQSGRIARWRSAVSRSCQTAVGGGVTVSLRMLRQAAWRSTPSSAVHGGSRAHEGTSAVSASSTACSRSHARASGTRLTASQATSGRGGSTRRECSISRRSFMSHAT